MRASMPAKAFILNETILMVDGSSEECLLASSVRVEKRLWRKMNESF